MTGNEETNDWDYACLPGLLEWIQCSKYERGGRERNVGKMPTIDGDYTPECTLSTICCRMIKEDDLSQSINDWWPMILSSSPLAPSSSLSSFSFLHPDPHHPEHRQTFELNGPMFEVIVRRVCVCHVHHFVIFSPSSSSSSIYPI